MSEQTLRKTLFVVKGVCIAFIIAFALNMLIQAFQLSYTINPEVGIHGSVDAYKVEYMETISKWYFGIGASLIALLCVICCKAFIKSDKLRVGADILIFAFSMACALTCAVLLVKVFTSLPNVATGSSITYFRHSLGDFAAFSTFQIDMIVPIIVLSALTVSEFIGIIKQKSSLLSGKNTCCASNVAAVADIERRMTDETVFAGNNVMETQTAENTCEYLTDKPVEDISVIKLQNSAGEAPKIKTNNKTSGAYKRLFRCLATLCLGLALIFSIAAPSLSGFPSHLPVCYLSRKPSTDYYNYSDYTKIYVYFECTDGLESIDKIILTYERYGLTYTIDKDQIDSTSVTFELTGNCTFVKAVAKMKNGKEIELEKLNGKSILNKSKSFVISTAFASIFGVGTIVFVVLSFIPFKRKRDNNI